MSIFIKGMKMPEVGVYSCELGVIDENTATLTIYTPIDKPQRSYKLITIPTHGQLTEDDVETIRIHLNAFKEDLCNQHRWKEAEEYQRIIDRFVAFASTQSERKTGKWVKDEQESLKHVEAIYRCSACNNFDAWGETEKYNYCPNCGAKMDVDTDDGTV